ncbi:hypothetical protein CCMA1212_001471 [Trichoderma ghanense]|uniref:Uncharacterized protein n=1 Tax=Trichoderma ghanense TaxID=65468 RepID=A0ABY2HEG0_9HYPO
MSHASGPRWASPEHEYLVDSRAMENRTSGVKEGRHRALRARGGRVESTGVIALAPRMDVVNVPRSSFRSLRGTGITTCAEQQQRQQYRYSPLHMCQELCAAAAS